MIRARREVNYRIYAFPSQRRFYDSSARYSGFSGPVGSGKTFALVYKALRMATENPGCVGLLGAPTIPMLRSVTLRAMLETLETHRMPFDYLSQSASLFLKRSRSSILFRPLDFFDRLRGYNLA
jgi:hypothetical protein